MSSTDGWNLGYLRLGALVTAVAGAVAVPVAWLIWGFEYGLGVALGLVVVVVFFAVSGLVVAWVGRRNEAAVLPAALGTFALKALVLYAMVLSLPVDGPISTRAFGWAVVLGVLGWQALHIRWVLSQQILYVDPAPINGPED